jgi:hypothetical protein
VPTTCTPPAGGLVKSKENTGFSLTGSKVCSRASSRSPLSRTDRRFTWNAGMPPTAPVSIGCITLKRKASDGSACIGQCTSTLRIGLRSTITTLCSMGPSAGSTCTLIGTFNGSSGLRAFGKGRTRYLHAVVEHRLAVSEVDALHVDPGCRLVRVAAKLVGRRAGRGAEQRQGKSHQDQRAHTASALHVGLHRFQRAFTQRKASRPLRGAPVSKKRPLDSLTITEPA